MFIDDVPAWLVRGFAFLFGSLWGSFFNVAIYRWPREMSVVTPPSHCPACGAPVRPYHNVPLLGYLLLRGRARCCGARLSPRYFFVELISAVLCLALAERLIVMGEPGAAFFPAAVETLIYFFFVGGLIVATFVDLEWMEIPDEVSLPGAALGLVTVTLRETPGAVDAALGAGMGYLGVQLLFVWSYERLFGRRGMGEGDAKLLLMIGAFLGWQGVLFSMVAGSLQGLVAAAVAFATGHRLTPTGSDARPSSPPEGHEADDGGAAPDEGGARAAGDVQGELAREGEQGREQEDEEGPAKLPFGPFLALGALQFLFFGPQLVDWYFDLIAG